MDTVTFVLANPQMVAIVIAHRSEQLRAGRRQHFKRIRKAFGSVSPRDVEHSDVWEFYSQQKMTSQARHEVAALSAVMGCAEKWGALKQHALLLMTLPDSRAGDRHVTDEEFGRCLRARGMGMRRRTGV